MYIVVEFWDANNEWIVNQQLSNVINILVNSYVWTDTTNVIHNVLPHYLLMFFGIVVDKIDASKFSDYPLVGWLIFYFGQFIHWDSVQVNSKKNMYQFDRMSFASHTHSHCIWYLNGNDWIRYYISWFLIDFTKFISKNTIFVFACILLETYSWQAGL